MAQAITETTTLVPWKREAQAVPRILLGDVPQRRLPRRRHDAALTGVHALIAGFTAGKAQIDRLRYEARQADAQAKAERRQELKTKLTAFAVFYLMLA
jgi:hypothetical protein